MIKEVLDKHGLKRFNDTINDRLKNRVKYKGEYALVNTVTNWNELAPTHIGDIYMLTGDEPIVIDEVTYRGGEWIIAMNETRLAADGTVIDETGVATDVSVEKLGSAGLPTGQNDGDAIVFVDGEWIVTGEYGYDTIKKLDEVYTVRLSQSNSSQVKTFIPAFTISEVGTHYKVYIDGTLRSEGVSKMNYDGTALTIDMGNDWINPADGGLSGCQYWFVSGTGEYDTTIDHEIRIVSEEQTHIIRQINKKYIPNTTIEDLGGNWLPSIAQEGVFYLHKHLVNNGPLPAYERFSLSGDRIAEGYAMDRWDGITKDGAKVMSWEQLSAEWEDMFDFFVQDNNGRVGRFGFCPDYGSNYYRTLWLNEDGSPCDIPSFYYQLYLFKTVPNSTSGLNAGWHKIWEGFPDGGITNIGQLWMDHKLEMID